MAEEMIYREVNRMFYASRRKRQTYAIARSPLPKCVDQVAMLFALQHSITSEPIDILFYRMQMNDEYCVLAYYLTYEKNSYEWQKKWQAQQVHWMKKKNEKKKKTTSNQRHVVRCVWIRVL